MSNRPGRLAPPPSLLLAFLVLLPLGAEAGQNALLQAGPIGMSAARAQHADRVTPEPDSTPSVRAGARGRPALLVPLYVSFGVLQGLDGHSTLTAMSRGFREVNPIMSPAVRSPGALIAAKAAASAATIAGTELLWRRNRVAAVLTIIAINVGYAAVVAHNYRGLARGR